VETVKHLNQLLLEGEYSRDGFEDINPVCWLTWLQGCIIYYDSIQIGHHYS